MLTARRPDPTSYDDVKGVTILCRVLLPFGAGLYLSFLFRVINALIAPRLGLELEIGAAGQGTITSIYFLAFAASQLAVGRLLDRFGPRRVQAGLLLIGASGVVLFAIGGSLWFLTLARALMALGFSASLASGVKAVVIWLPRERVALGNGWMMTFGALGAISATGPSNIVMQALGWRGLLGVSAFLTLAVSALIYFVVPDRRAAALPGRRDISMPLRTILTNRDFLRVALLTSLAISVPWAMQALWATPWLKDVAGYDHATIVGILFGMGCTLCVGGVLFGSVADRLGARGITTDAVFSGAVLALLIVEILILARAPLPAYLLWGALSLFGNLPALGFAIMGELFAQEIIGRISSAFTMLNFATAFVVQAGMGYIIVLWPSTTDGHVPSFAYEAAFAVPCALQVAAFCWFLTTGGLRSASRSKQRDVRSNGM
jgi:MFS family permease